MCQINPSNILSGKPQVTRGQKFPNWQPNNVGEISDKIRATKVLSVDFNVGCAFMHLYAKNNADSDASNVHLKNENENIAKPQELTVQIRHNLSSWGNFSSLFLLCGGQPSFLFFF